MKKRLLLVFTICALFSALTGRVVETAEKRPYRVGAIFSLSGRGALLGVPEKKTVRMIEEIVNRSGGIHGHPLEILVRNDRSRPHEARAAAKELIEDEKVLAIIGPSLSGTSLEIVSIAEESKTPMISCGASYQIVTADQTTGEQYRWVFKTPQSDSMAAAAIYTHMRKNGISKIAVLSSSTGFGKSGRHELLRLAPAFGIDVVADEIYGPRETSMVTQLMKIKGLDHQAIVNWSIGVTQILILKQWRELGMSMTPFYQSHGFGSPRNIALAGNAGEGVFCPLGACNIAAILPEDHPQKKVALEYLRDYKEKYDEPVSSFGGHAWDALSLLIDALESVGPDKEKIREHLEYRRGFVGQHGVFNFSPIDHNGLGRDSFIMVVVRDGWWALAD